MESKMDMVDEKSSDDANKKPLVVQNQEKGTRNKRKFLYEEAPNGARALSLTEFPRYELLEEKLRRTINELELLEGGGSESDEKQADWEEPIACQLTELLSSNLSATFKSAVKKIIESGQSEEIAEQVILRSGLYYGSKDVVSNIVDGALALLNKEKDLDISGYLVFPTIPSLAGYTIVEMIYVLREVRPELSLTEAMWCLLISDLNLVHACTAKGNLLADLRSQETLGDSASGSQISQSKTEAAPEVTQTNLDKSQSSKSSIPVAQSLESKVPTVGAEPNSGNSVPSQAAIAGKGNSVPLPESNAKSSASSKEHNQTPSKAAAVSEGKAGAGKKGPSLNSKKNLLRHTAFQFERNYKGCRMGKGGTVKAKLSAWSSVIMEDKPLDSQSGSSAAPMKSSSSNVKTAVRSNNPIAEGNADSSRPPSSISPASNTSGVPPVQDTNKKAPASSALEPKSSVKAAASTITSSPVTDYYAGIPYDEALGKYVPQNKSDETILLLIPQMEKLQKELQGWSDWANEKVMQAAKRLGMEKAELKTLRQEKEDAEKFHKEKQLLEESTTKRISEMEYALLNAGGQIETANSSLKKLEGENTVLKKELEASKLSAAESAANLDKALANEQETMKKCQAGEMETRLLQEKSSNLKHAITDLQKKLEKAKQRLDQFEILWKQEKREKQKSLQRTDSLKAEREKLVAKGEQEEDNIREKVASRMQKGKEDIQKLETEIAQLRFLSERAKIRAFNYEDNSGSSGVKMERECVMCLAEEMTVVFLPCAHQVLCANCNVLHEKQGMKDCPSCRTPIKKRLNVRFPNF